MMDMILQRRTGLSDAAKGLDPKALQSSTMIGVDAIISGAQERIELIARVLAETGFKDLFQGIYNEICENPDQQRTLHVRGKWVDFDTSVFDASMNVEVNPTLGKGTDMARLSALTQIKQEQQMIMQQFGISNPVCSITEYINTLSDMMELANIRNIGRYFKTPDPQALQAIMSAPKEPDPMAVAAKAQFEKVKSDTAAKAGQMQFQEEKLRADDAFRQKKLEQERQLEEQQLNLQRQEADQQHEAALAKTASEHVVGMAKATKPTNGGGV
jgi:hypothetical protein